MVVTDDAIVYKCNARLMVKVRMCIHIGLISVSCPSSVPNTDLVIMLISAISCHTLDAVSAEPVRTCELCRYKQWFTGFFVFCN